VKLVRWEEIESGHVRLTYENENLPGLRTDTQIQKAINDVLMMHSPARVRWTVVPMLFDDEFLKDPDADFRDRRAAAVGG